MRLYGPATVVLSVLFGVGGIAYQTPACTDGNCSVAEQTAEDESQCEEHAAPTPKLVETAVPPVRQQTERAPTQVVPLNAQGYNYRKDGPAEPRLFTGAEPSPALPAAPEKK